MNPNRKMLYEMTEAELNAIRPLTDEQVIELNTPLLERSTASLKRKEANLTHWFAVAGLPGPLNYDGSSLLRDLKAIRVELDRRALVS